MKTYITLLFGTLLFLSSCQHNVLDDMSVDQPKSRASAGPTLFTNVEKYEYDSGEQIIEGDIYCPEDTEYTVIFACQGTDGFAYDARFGNLHFYPSNGGKFREVTTTLRAGTHHCCVGVQFSGPDQNADVRMVIKKINGSQAGSFDGVNDLVIHAVSNTWYEWGTSVPVHWTCKFCGFFLNGEGSNYCISCKKERE